MVRVFVLAAMLAAVPCGYAAACVCDHPKNLDDAAAKADLVFQGYPMARFARRGANGIPGWDYAFVIQRQWKSEPQYSYHMVFSDCGGCGQIFARNVSYVVFASRYDGYETSRCSTWNKSRYPVGADDAVVRALGPPAFEASGDPPALVTEADERDDFGWPSGAPWSLPDSDLPPSPADDLDLDERHRVWHGLLLTIGVLLVVYPSIRAGRSGRRRPQDEST